MPELETPQNPPALGPEPELHLLLSNQTLDEPIWKSLFRNIDDSFFPKKLPPLVLTSKPIPVRDIWGFYNYKGRGVAGSTVVHVLALALIIVGTYVGRKIVVAQPKETVVLIAPGDIPPLPPSKTLSGGGGGGGDRDKLQASPGRLPKQSMQQITPPLAVVRNPQPKLAVAPTIVVPPDIHLQQPNMPDLGDPLSRLPSVPSNGTGYGGGIGTGSGGGVGSGSGPGYGPGSGGGTGGGVLHVGGGVSAPARSTIPTRSIPRKPGRQNIKGVRSPRDRRAGWQDARHPRVPNPGLGTGREGDRSRKDMALRARQKRRQAASVAVNIEVEFRLLLRVGTGDPPVQAVRSTAPVGSGKTG